MEDDVARTIRRINDVLGSDLSPEVAYPLRARLGRAVMQIAKISKKYEIDNASELWDSLVFLEDTCRHIMQPSEPFDSHWPEQWESVVTELGKVRVILTGSETAAGNS